MASAAHKAAADKKEDENTISKTPAFDAPITSDHPTVPCVSGSITFKQIRKLSNFAVGAKAVEESAQKSIADLAVEKFQQEVQEKEIAVKRKVMEEQITNCKKYHDKNKQAWYQSKAVTNCKNVAEFAVQLKQRCPDGHSKVAYLVYCILKSSTKTPYMNRSPPRRRRLPPREV